MTRRLRWWSLPGLLLAVVPARAATRTFPSTPPCSTTLQECLDGADDGDRIEIVTTAPIGGGPLQIRKSVTLTGGPGVTPILGGGVMPFGVMILGNSAGPSVIRLEGLTISNGSVRVVLAPSPGGDEVTIQRCSISNTFAGSAILVDPDVPADVQLLDNFLASGGYVIDTLMSQASGTIHLTIARNRLSASTSGYDGVQLDMRGAGQTIVDVESNVIHDVTSSAIVMYSLDSVAATVNVVNNTIDQAAKGVYVTTIQDTSTIALRFFNNIVSRTTGAGASFPASAQLSVSSGFNAFFGIGAPNVLNGFDLGMPLYGVDPLYVDADGADYHLKGTSTLINAGTNAPPTGLPELDYEGNLRIADSSVDVGAYEFGSMPPTTTTTTVVTSSTTTTTLACTAEATAVSIGCRLAVLTTDVSGQVPAGKLRDKLLAQLATATGALQEADAATGKTRKRALRRVVKALTIARVRLNTKPAKALDAALRSALAERLVGLKRDAKTLSRSS